MNAYTQDEPYYIIIIYKIYTSIYEKNYGKKSKDAHAFQWAGHITDGSIPPSKHWNAFCLKPFHSFFSYFFWALFFFVLPFFVTLVSNEACHHSLFYLLIKFLIFFKL